MDTFWIKIWSTLDSDNKMDLQNFLKTSYRNIQSLYNILEDFEKASPYVCTFLQTVYVIEKLLAGFNVQPRIGMNQSLI